MAKKSIVLLPETEDILARMGMQIKYARLRRRLPAELVAERAGISRATLVSIEKGLPSVAIGCYAAVLHALNYMDKDLLLVAKDDELLHVRQRTNNFTGQKYKNIQICPYFIINISRHRFLPAHLRRAQKPNRRPHSYQALQP